MIPTQTSRSVVNISATAEKHSDLAKYTLPLHTLTRYDTVSMLYGKDKVKALKTLKQRSFPSPMGATDVSVDVLETKAVPFIAKCYGSKITGTMDDVRFNVWQHKTARGKSKNFKLASLPPSSKAFQLHIRRAHYQACLWKASLESKLHDMNATEFGWKADHTTQTLVPITLPPGTLAAPKKVLNLLCCSCFATDAYTNQCCSCRKSDIACKCNISPNLQCSNPLNRTAADIVDNDETTDD